MHKSKIASRAKLHIADAVIDREHGRHRSLFLTFSVAGCVHVDTVYSTQLSKGNWQTEQKK